MSRASDDLATVNFLCSSLRQRRVWAATAAQLLQREGRRWREASLMTHDLALTAPDALSEGSVVFRLLLLSSEDLEQRGTETSSRIHQLYHLEKGQNAGVVFLLQRDGPQSAMQQFMELHIKTMNDCPMPILPLTSVDALPATLQSFQSSLAASRTRQPWPADAARDLLPRCTTGTLLARPSVDILRGHYFSFREVLGAVATDDGQRMLREILGPEETGRLRSFWSHEFAVPP